MRIAGIIENEEEAKMIERIMKVSLVGRIFGSLSNKDPEVEEDEKIDALIDTELNRLRDKNKNDLDNIIK